MADISAEIAAFKNAVYGEDVRDAMVSLANKLNTVVTEDHEAVDNINDRVEALEYTLTTYSGFNISVFEHNYINYTNGRMVPHTGDYWCTDYIELSVPIYVKTYAINDVSGIGFYNAIGHFISGYNPHNDNDEYILLSPPSDAKYVRITVYKNLHYLDIKYSDVFFKDVKYSDKQIQSISSTIIDGGYIHANDGTVVLINGYSYTDYEIFDPNIYAKTVVPEDMSSISFYDNDHSFIFGYNMGKASGLYTCIDYYTRGLTAQQKKKIRFFRLSMLTDYKDELAIVKISKNDLINTDNIFNVVSFERGYVAYNSGLLISHVLYVTSSFIEITNEHCKIKTWVDADYSGICFYDYDKTFISGYNTNEYSGTYHELDIPDNAKYIRFSCLSVYASQANIIFYGHSLTDYDIVVDSLNPIQAFSNIVCCGDSLTFSQVYTSNGSYRAHTTWPKKLQAISGIHTAWYATCGATPTSWWNEHASHITERDNCLVIIYLGTNAGLTDTLDTDAPEGTDYNTWTASNTAYYARMVAAWKDVGAKILLIHCYENYGNNTFSTTNIVIDKIATRFGCAVISNKNLGEVYHLYPDKTGSNGVHYNELGYSAFANSVYSKINNLSEAYLSQIIPEESNISPSPSENHYEE